MSSSYSSRATSDYRIHSLSATRGRARSAFTFDRGAGSSAQARSRSRASDRSADAARPSQRGRTGFSTSGRNGRGRGDRSRSAPGANANRPPRDDASFVEVVQRLSEKNPQLAPPALRKLLGVQPSMSHEQCMAAIKEGKCIICQGGNHSYKQCPCYKEPFKADIGRFLDAYKKARVECRDLRPH